MYLKFVCGPEFLHEQDKADQHKQLRFSDVGIGSSPGGRDKAVLDTDREQAPAQCGETISPEMPWDSQTWMLPGPSPSVRCWYTGIAAKSVRKV